MLSAYGDYNPTQNLNHVEVGGSGPTCIFRIRGMVADTCPVPLCGLGRRHHPTGTFAGVGH